MTSSDDLLITLTSSRGDQWHGIVDGPIIGSSLYMNTTRELIEGLGNSDKRVRVVLIGEDANIPAVCRRLMEIHQKRAHDR